MKQRFILGSPGFWLLTFLPPFKLGPYSQEQANALPPERWKDLIYVSKPSVAEGTNILDVVITRYGHGYSIADTNAPASPFNTATPLDMDYYANYVPPKCECGADSIGSGGHSSWCPKA